MGLNLSEIFYLFIVGFTFFIAVFDKKMAFAYMLFIIISSLLTMFFNFLFEKIKEKIEGKK